MKKYFILILIAAFFIRLIGMNTIIYGDEAYWPIELQNYNYFSLGKLIPHPLVSLTFYKLFTDIFGIKTYVLRLVPLIFGLATILIVYIISKKHYNEKAAYISIGLMALSFWHILASLQIDMDGSILLFFFTLTITAYLRYDEKKEKRWLFLIAILFGIALLTKISAIILVLIFGLYEITKKNKIKDIAKSIFAIGLLGLSLPVLYYFLNYLINPDLITAVFLHSSQRFSIIPTIRPIIFFIVFATPFYAILPFLGMLNKQKKDNIFFIWIVLPILFYIMIGKESAFDRYLMIIIPPICILSGNILSNIKFSRKSKYAFAVSFFFYLILLFFQNLNPIRYIPHSISNYIKEAINLKWDFFFHYTASSGPTFGIAFESLAITFILSFLFFLFSIFFYAKNKKYFIIFLSLFLGISFAFNIFIVQEYLFHTTQPNITKLTYDMVDFYNQNKLSGTLYSYTSVYFLLNKIQEDKYKLRYHITNNQKELDILNQNIKTMQGTIILIDYPVIRDKEKLLKTASQCPLLKTFSSKGRVFGYIYHCEPKLYS